MSLVVVSNRLPVSRGEDGWTTSPGGLVAALDPVLSRGGGTWVGWPGETDTTIEPFTHDGIDLVPVPLSAAEHGEYYDGLSNATLWPLYHHWVRPPILDEPDWWTSYRTVNDRFARAAADAAPPGATVWVHDYHLQLVPHRLRRLRDDIRIGFFLHIPFPPVELFQRLPWREEILKGLLGADVIGFQTEADAAHFRAAAESLGQPTVDGSHIVMADGRRIDVRAHPISIDAERCRDLAADLGVQALAGVIRDRVGEPETLFLGVDRLDYTKGIVERLEAFDQLLDRHPELTERVCLVQVAVPSRESVEEYERLRDEVERLVGRINGERGGLGRPVVHYHYAELDFEQVVALYLAADILLVTPLIDGMNLVAKEFAVTRDGEAAAIVISEFAGAAEELRAGADVVNAYDTDSVVAGIERAVGRSDDEKRRRSAELARMVTRRDVHAWAEGFLAAFPSVVTPRPLAPAGPNPPDAR